LSRFVRPDVRTLTLANGDTITVKQRLSAGEKREAYARMYQSGADGQLQRHPIMYAISMVCAYLVDWSLRDDDGKPVVIRDLSTDQLQSVVDSLAFEDFNEIKDAIQAHEDAMVAARDAQKKSQAGGTASPATSISRSDAGGPLTTSETSTRTTTPF
jgi:hypothetical protein